MGKSTLINKLIGEKITITSPIAQTTRNKLKGILTTNDGQIIFVDTPGVHKPHHRLGEILVKNLIMSSAQIIIHRRDNNREYEITSENISDRCKAILRLLETKSVTKSVNQVLRDLDDMGNSFDNSVKYDSEQKEFIKKQILDIAH